MKKIKTKILPHFIISFLLILLFFPLLVSAQARGAWSLGDIQDLIDEIADFMYYIGITVPMVDDSTYTRLYPSKLDTGTDKPFFVITDKQNPDIIFNKDNKKWKAEIEIDEELLVSDLKKVDMNGL